MHAESTSSGIVPTRRGAAKDGIRAKGTEEDSGPSGKKDRDPN